jgi:hypothetical protein
MRHSQASKLSSTEAAVTVESTGLKVGDDAGETVSERVQQHRRFALDDGVAVLVQAVGP